MAGHFGFSQVPGCPSFRSAAVNAVAVVPLLSRDHEGDISSTHSARSFQDLLTALQRYNQQRNEHVVPEDNVSDTTDLLLVVPNSSLTRPGDWRYSETPLKSFHWQAGCQRLLLFDGRPTALSRTAQDRLLNTANRNWIDLCPSRRTAAVIGVLNMHDCHSEADLHRAEEELHQWAIRYATPPYEVTAKGHSFERDTPVERLFVYDSFDTECQKIDLTASQLGSASILAFPPADADHAQMMDLHLNVVVNDLAVAVFTQLEAKIKDSDAVLANYEAAFSASAQAAASSARRSFQRYVSLGSADSINAGDDEQPKRLSGNLGVSSMAGLVSPESKLAKDSPNSGGSSTSLTSSTSGGRSYFRSDSPSVASKKTPDATTKQEKTKPMPQLLTPLDLSFDDEHGMSPASNKDTEAVRRRDQGRREKYAADLCLLAGSPLDAYERYLKAAELCKSSAALDPLWHASALEGCATAHIAMAEAGGYSVDEYLENNFTLPEDILALAKEQPGTTRHKQTLPEVISALTDEALNILNRNKLLSHLYAELLLKLAWYTAESAEGHLRCQWGEGEGCFAGELGEPPRWQSTGVSKLNFNDWKTAKGGDMLQINTFVRTRSVCELLSRAASVGNLDPATRVDVAARCARICLYGVKPTRWKNPTKERVKLPRKAAFFATVAAEAVSEAKSSGTMETARSVWLLATQLYSQECNPVEGGGNYGWRVLRAACLEALSMQGNTKLSLESAGELLSLLAELSPKKDHSRKRSKGTAVEEIADMAVVVEKVEDEDEEKVEEQEEGSGRSVIPRRVSDAAVRALSIEEGELNEAINTASQFAKNLRDSYSKMAGAANYLAQQSKWADGEPIQPVQVPLEGSSSISSSLSGLGSEWSSIDFDTCSAAQQRCMARIVALRRAIPASSGVESDHGTIYSPSLMRPPLFVSSAMAIQSESMLEMEFVKKRSSPDRSKQGAMATFFNPYDSSKKTEESASTRVAEEEERAMLVKFGNRLSIPLEVQRSQLEFDKDVDGRVKAAALLFTIPPKATAFKVYFPFTILSKAVPAENESDDFENFEVKGIDLTCLGRSIFLPIQAINEGNRSTDKKGEEETVPRIEAYRCQPRLQVLFAESGAPAEKFSLGLSDGEVYNIPAFSLENYTGPSGRGRIERLQIFVAGLAGPSDMKIFDSDSAQTSEESEEEFVKELIHGQSPPPLKVRALTRSLKLASINGSHDSSTADRKVNFQIAAAHNMAQALSSETATVTLRFRYRGISGSSAEVWRKREVILQISPVKGPRISSISLRPDLAKESAFAEMLELNERDAPGNIPDDKKEQPPIPEDARSALYRIGVDAEISVCGEKSFLLLTVANETRSFLSISSPKGPVGGFEGNPLSKVTVRPGVSAKFPVVMSRIPRVTKDGSPTDVIAQLISKTSLVWESHKGYKGGETGPVEARGYIRIPTACLNDIMDRRPSFFTHLCEPPCKVDFYIGQKASTSTTSHASLGKPLDVSVEVSTQSWVPKAVVDGSQMTIEFRCVRMNGQRDARYRRDYVWAGKIQQKVPMKDCGKHRIKIAFCAPGDFAVSACARISRGGGSGEEVWWAPVAQRVHVEAAEFPPQ